RDARAEVDAVVAARSRDHRRAADPGVELAQTPVDLAQLLAAVDVLGVFGTVSLRRGGGDLLQELRALLVPEALPLGLEPGVTFGADGVGHGAILSGQDFVDGGKWTMDGRS